MFETIGMIIAVFIGAYLIFFGAITLFASLGLGSQNKSDFVGPIISIIIGVYIWCVLLEKIDIVIK